MGHAPQGKIACPVLGSQGKGARPIRPLWLALRGGGRGSYETPSKREMTTHETFVVPVHAQGPGVRKDFFGVPPGVRAKYGGY